MSVFDTITGLKTLPLASNDPRFPIWRFMLNGALVADATGGSATLFMVIRPTGQPQSGQVIGIRSIFTTEGANSGIVSALAQRFVLVQEQGVDEVINFQFTSTVIASAKRSSALNVDTILGQHTRGAANAQIEIDWAANEDGITMQAYVEGFIWTAEALYRGGPLFPGQFPTP